LEIHYHPGKANDIADALSRKARCNCLLFKPKSSTLCDEFRRLGLEMVEEGFLANLEVKSTLLDQIIEAQRNDNRMAQIRDFVKEAKPNISPLTTRGLYGLERGLLYQRILN